MGSKLSYTNEELALLNDYRYKVQRYIVSHKQLTIVAHPIAGDDIPIYITFLDVKYLQLPTYWEAASFRVASQDECRVLMGVLGLKIVGKHPYLYYAELPSTRINIICGLTMVSDTMPES